MSLARSGMLVAALALLGQDAAALAQRVRTPAQGDKPPATLPVRGAASGAAAGPAGQAAPSDAKASDAKASDAKTPDAKPFDAKPYDPQLMRLAEILGALTYLGSLCGEPGADGWRQRMQALLDAEGQPALRRDRLAGAFNEGLKGYELSYRSCTDNARAVIARFLAEGSRLAQDVENRYRAS